MGVKSGSGKVFNWFANMTSVAGLMTWFGISITYIRFYAGMKAQGIDRSKLPYASVLQPFAAWYGAFMCILICFVRVSSHLSSANGLIRHCACFYSSADFPYSSKDIGPPILSQRRIFR